MHVGVDNGDDGVPGNVPPALVHGVDWIQHPETGSWWLGSSSGMIHRATRFNHRCNG